MSNKTNNIVTSKGSMNLCDPCKMIFNALREYTRHQLGVELFRQLDV